MLWLEMTLCLLNAFLWPMILVALSFESLGSGFGVSEKKDVFLFWAWPMGTMFLHRLGWKIVIFRGLAKKFSEFQKMIVLQKLWKMLFISSKKLFSFSRFLYFHLPLFLSLLATALEDDLGHHHCLNKIRT